MHKLLVTVTIALLFPFGAGAQTAASVNDCGALAQEDCIAKLSDEVVHQHQAAITERGVSAGADQARLAQKLQADGAAAAKLQRDQDWAGYWPSLWGGKDPYCVIQNGIASPICPEKQP